MKHVARLVFLLAGVAFLGCGKRSQETSVRNADELAVLAQSSFYANELAPKPEGSDGGFYPGDGGSGNGGADGGVMPGPGGTNPGEPTPVVPEDPPADPGPIAQNPPAPPAPQDPPAPVIPEPPVPETPSTDPGPIAQNPPDNGGSDGGNLPPPDGGGNGQPDGGSVPPPVVPPPPGPIVENPPAPPGPIAENPPAPPQMPPMPPVVPEPPAPPGPIVENPPASPVPPETPVVPPVIPPPGDGGVVQNPPTPTEPPVIPPPGDGGVVQNPPSPPPGGDDGVVPPPGPGPDPDGGNVPCPKCGVDVTMYRVCSVKRSAIPYPKFIFFEEAQDPILTLEASVTAPRSTPASRSLASAAGQMPHPMESHLLNLVLNPRRGTRTQLVVGERDLEDVDLMKGRFKTRLALAVEVVKEWFPRTWKEIYVSANVCEDSNADGLCQGESDPRQLLAKETGFKLGHIPKELKLLVWNGRSKTLKRDPRICEEQYSPIVLDLSGDGFRFTSALNGVWFDLNDTGEPVMTGWTNGRDDAFLVRDLNGNGRIDSGAELFGSATELADGTKAANGFIAMRELDSNGNGVLDSGDAAWTDLRLWIDRSHNGEADRGELFSLDAAGVVSISLSYQNSVEVDPHGNETRQRSTFRQKVRGRVIPRQVIDVWFNTLNAD